MLLKRGKKAAALLLALCLCLALAPQARAVDGDISFLSYEEALPYFDFSLAASNWCLNFGLDPETQKDQATSAILAGTDRQLVIRLATYARDTGHGTGSLSVSNAFRPACYQEVIGLHDGNANTGPFRNALTWRGESVTQFWFTAESAPGWPEDYTLDLAAYDIAALDLRWYYRAALRLWGNGWVGNYFAKPGCSAHNSGTAIDILSDWLGGDFRTEHSYNGQTFAMADYGLYKPLQPNGWSAGETWHITSSASVLALGNYDGALQAGYEIVYGIYYNPVSRGWAMSDGRGLVLGAGVTVIQLRLCQLGLLDAKYVTGFFCTATEAAVKAFQGQNGLEADGVCGGGTLALLFPAAAPSGDMTAPVLTAAETVNAGNAGFTLRLAGTDGEGLSAFRVDTRAEGDENWVSRYYNADKTGGGLLDIDIWSQGVYEVRAAAVDAAGNESALTDLPAVFVDTTPPRLLYAVLSELSGSGFSLRCRAEDNVSVASFLVALTNRDTGERQEYVLLPDENGAMCFDADMTGGGVWRVAVSVWDGHGNSAGHEFTRLYDPALYAQPDDTAHSYYGPLAG